MNLWISGSIQLIGCITGGFIIVCTSLQTRSDYNFFSFSCFSSFLRFDLSDLRITFIRCLVILHEYRFIVLISFNIDYMADCNTETSYFELDLLLFEQFKLSIFDIFIILMNEIYINLIKILIFIILNIYFYKNY